MQYWFLALLAGVFLLGVLRPYLGVVAFITLLPVETLLPTSLVSNLDVVTSPIALVGAVAALGAACALVGTGELNARDVLADPVKLAALREHKSQMGPWDPTEMLTQWAREQGRPRKLAAAESYRRMLIGGA